MLKVLILGLYEEREFYIDIGSIPQDWKMKSLAELLNKMYAAQLGDNHCKGLIANE